MKLREILTEANVDKPRMNKICKDIQNIHGVERCSWSTSWGNHVIFKVALDMSQGLDGQHRFANARLHASNEHNEDVMGGIVKQIKQIVEKTYGYEISTILPYRGMVVPEKYKSYYPYEDGFESGFKSYYQQWGGFKSSIISFAIVVD